MSETAPEKFLMEKLNITLPDLGIAARTSCTAVALVATRPTNSQYKIIL